MKRVFSVLVGLCLVVAGSFLYSDVTSAQGQVTVLGVWGGAEEEAFMEMVRPFEEETGIEVLYEGTRDLPTILTTRIEAGNPPDIVHLTGPGLLMDLLRRDAVVDLRNVLDMDSFTAEYDDTWLDLARGDDDGIYGVFISADLKSLVWYSPPLFEEYGYEIPETWDELMELSDQMVADGVRPWSIGLESGAASGWPGTDWIEDILLRTAGPEVYDQWIFHEIPWTSPEIREAFELFGQIARDPNYVYGGPVAVLTMDFGDAADPLFTDPPRAFMHRQASFITSFIEDRHPDLVPGEDFDFFPFPTINPEHGNPMMGAADMMSMTNDTPEARALIEYLSSAEAQEIWVGKLGKLGVNTEIDPAAYPDDLTRRMAATLHDAPEFRFDASDSMPAAVGSGAFWEGILNYVGGDDLDAVLEYIESVAQDTY